MNKIAFISILIYFSNYGLAQSQFPIKFKMSKSTSGTFTANQARHINESRDENTARISFTGDLLVHHDLYNKVADDPKNDFTILWKKTIPLFEKADFSYANLEGPTALGIDKLKKDQGDVGFIYKKDMQKEDNVVYSGTHFLFNFHPKIIDDLRKTGIDLVSTSNNHTFDRGSIGIDKTIDEMNKRNFNFVGTRKKNSQDAFYKIFPVKNVNIAWIACTEALNGFNDRFSQTLLCFDQKKEIIEMIKTLKARSDVDVIIITPHWGTEYQHEPTQMQKTVGREFLEQGALAVIGSHPHVLQPVEKYTTADGRETFIAYSLGNFVAYQKDLRRKVSALIYLDFTKDPRSGKTTLTNYTYEPTVRFLKDIFPARHLKEVVEHAEQFLGPLD